MGYEFDNWGRLVDMRTPPQFKDQGFIGLCTVTSSETKREMEEGGGEKKKKKVLVGIDESECSRYALEWALQNLTRTLSDSKLIIFSAQPIDDLGYAYALSLAPQLIQSLQDNRKKLTLALLQKAKEICAQHGIDAETLTETGNPKEAICEAVEKLKVQLLVVGSHGRGSLQRAFLGSVSNYCVHHAKCPVLVVKKKPS